MTGAGMMDCKQALAEAEGDFEKAVEVLRKKGQKVAGKRADREATEGVVLAKVVGNRGAVVVLNCETDFVAKNEDFIKLTQAFLDLALEHKPADLQELLALPHDGVTVNDTITMQVGVIGEKIELSAYESIEAPAVVAYIHPGNRLATLVGFNKAEVPADVAKDVAMQVAAMAPIAVDQDGVDAHTIEKEIEIGKELAMQEGKPAEMAEKIARGRLNKFFQEKTLLKQEFIKDNKHSVQQYLDHSVKGLTVNAFKRLSLEA